MNVELEKVIFEKTRAFVDFFSYLTLLRGINSVWGKFVRKLFIVIDEQQLEVLEDNHGNIFD